MYQIKALATLVVLALALACAAMVTAGEDETIPVEREQRMHVVVGGEAEAVDLDDLEVGESRQILTDSGKEIVATRTEEGFELTIDGREIQLHGHGEGDAATAVSLLNGLLAVHGGEEGARHVFIQRGDGERGEHAIHVEGEPGAYALRLDDRRRSALEHLRDTGVLDELDEASRQKVVDALEAFEAEGPQVRKKVIVLGGEGRSDDDPDAGER